MERLHSMHGLGVRPQRVLPDVGRHDLAVELLGQVEDVVGDAELLGHPAGVLDVGHRAAARVRRPAPQLERGPDHLMALLDQQRRRHGGVDASRHGHEHPHGTSVPPGLSPPGAVRPPRRDDGEGAVDVVLRRAIPQREADGTRRQLRGDPHGGEDVARLQRPAGTGRPAGDADALLPQRHQELLALDARHTEVQVAREHVDPARGGRRRHRAVGALHRVAAARRAAGRAGPPPAAPPSARSAATRRSAVASPTAPATSWVPLRRSRSCPPPYWRGSSTTRPAMASAPTPTGPPTLCALSETRSAPAVTSARSRKGAACTASVNT